MKINYTKLKDESEVDCTRRFLPVFNEFHKSHFDNPVKNTVQNEIDVFCSDFQTGKCLRIQIKKADPIIVGNLGKSRKVGLKDRPVITRDHNQAVDNILNNIEVVVKKYLKQGKDMSDVILLLDEMMDPSELILQKVMSEVAGSTFKEIWLVSRNRVYKIN